MKATKRFATSDSAPDTNDSTFRNKRIMAGSPFDVHRAEPSQQQSTATPPLDMQRAESSRQHVRALNTQFASWVQTQLKNHPDELWEDGIRDYLAHASNIVEKFSDVVNWLKANALKGNLSATETQTGEKKSVSEIKNNEVKLSQEKKIAQAATGTSFAASWTSGVFSNSQPSLFSNSQPTAFSNSQSSVPSNSQHSLFSNSQSSVLSNSQPSLFSNSQSSVLSNSQPSLFSNSQSSGLSNSQTSLFSSGQSSVFSSSQPSLFSNSNPSVFSNSQPSLFSNSQPIAFSNSQPSVFSGSQSSVLTNHNVSNNVDEEDELPQPGSPSVKKSEEKGIVTVHEVKCKLYVKSSDPVDKDTWKDKGTGQLSIKCKEGISKGTKESKPTIVVRNDVGRVLLNALLYPGIKTNLQKNSLVAIFHTSGDDAGGDGNGSVVARTFLIRTKTEDDRNKLATAIKEYAPAA